MYDKQLDGLVQYRLKLPTRVVMALRGEAVRRSAEAGRFVSWCAVAHECLEYAAVKGVPKC